VTTYSTLGDGGGDRDRGRDRARRAWGRDPEVLDGDGAAEPDDHPDQPRRRAAEGDYTRFLLPAELWQRSPQLTMIYNAAKARNISPDAVLMCVLAHLAATLVRGSEVYTGSGASPLNTFVALIGASGTGKTKAAICAEDLLRDYLAAARHHYGQTGLINTALGSGEGMIQAFMGKAPKDGAGDTGWQRSTGADTQVQVRGNAFFHADEGRTALAQGSRSGSTLFGTLCSLWSGQAVGQANASAERNRHLARDSYSIGLMMGFQPTTVADLFADDNGGTPQRFLFASASYSPWADLDDDDVAEWPGRLGIRFRQEVTLFTLAEDQQREIRVRARARHHPDFADKPLDAHSDLIRARVAALLALLHDTRTVGPDGWELAGVICRRSSALRDHIAGATERRRKAEGERRKADAIEVGKAIQDHAHARSALDKAVSTIVAAVERAGADGITPGRARNAAKRYPTEVQHAALAAAVEAGQIVSRDDLLFVPD
jgi:hypothetical protein